MGENFLACCYFPSTIILIDDNTAFLKATERHVKLKWPYELYRSPEQALNRLNEEDPLWTSIEKAIYRPDNEESNQRILDIDIREIHNEVYNKNRFAIPSVVIVDYAMPGMNGVEFCEKLKDKRIKKVMLTGEADHNIAVKAFNDGIIDQFITKKSPNVVEELKTAIVYFQEEYFKERTHVIVDSLINSPLSMYKITCLKDREFIKYFKVLCQENGIVEYYLVDDLGGFLLLDKQGKTSWLVSRSSEEMRQIYIYASEDEITATDDILAQLKARTHLPFFFTQEDYSISFAEMGKYMHPSVELKGEYDTYSIAHVTDPNAYTLNREYIDSYQSYLDRME